MFQVDVSSGRGIEDAQMCFGVGRSRREHGFIPVPFGRVHVEVGRGEHLAFACRGRVDKLHAEFLFLPACPHAEAVAFSCPEPDAEESFILQPCAFLVMGGREEADVVRIAFEGTVVVQRDMSERAPPHEVLGELERAIFHQFGIEAAVGPEVDVFEEMPVHRGLYLCPLFARLDDEVTSLCVQAEACGEREGCQ